MGEFYSYRPRLTPCDKERQTAVFMPLSLHVACGLSEALAGWRNVPAAMPDRKGHVELISDSGKKLRLRTERNANERLSYPFTQSTSSACPWDPDVAVFAWCASRAVPERGLQRNEPLCLSKHQRCLAQCGPGRVHPSHWHVQ